MESARSGRGTGRGSRAVLVAAALLALACPASSPVPPVPEDLEAIDTALAEWIWKLQSEIEARPQRARPFLNLCLLYRANDLDALARECLERLVAAHPDYAQGWYHLGYACRDTDDLAGAVEAMRTASRLEPRYRPSRLRLTDWSLALGQLEAGESPSPTLMDRPLGDDPWRAEEELFWVGYSARLRLADDYLEGDQPETALEILDALQARFPADVPVLKKRGAILRGLGRFEQALETFETALEISDAADRTVIVAAADCALRLRRWERAAAGYERAIALDPDDARSQSRLGLVALRLQRYERAETALSRALALGVDDPDPIRAALAKVRQLEGSTQPRSH